MSGFFSIFNFSDRPTDRPFTFFRASSNFKNCSGLISQNQFEETAQYGSVQLGATFAHFAGQSESRSPNSKVNNLLHKNHVIHISIIII